MLATRAVTGPDSWPDTGAGLRKRRSIMGDDRTKGTAKQVKGNVKETAGKVTGDKKLEFEGKTDKAAGSVQKNIGKAKDAARK
jgi:uncharacterized protein YjbJ (UPF0337 family)